MKKESLINFLYSYFDVANIKDVSQNGLQVDNSKKEINKIIFAVDASLETIELAKKEKADMLFVHHGLFWGKSLTITDLHYKRIKTLIDGDIALVGMHLPLDMHKEVGNNYTMAKVLGLKNLEGFGEFMGNKIGVVGDCKTKLNVDEIIKKLNFEEAEDLKFYPFGFNSISRIAIVSGGAADDIEDAKFLEKPIDLFISGEHSHSAYSKAKELGINLLLGGHYRTEVFGVRETAKMLKKEFKNLECKFVDCPSGM